MSADNWAQCPKCFENEQKLILELRNQAKELYGKIPAEEYLSLLQKANEQSELEFTLREDWEIGFDLETGIFSIKYWCGCRKCNFEFEYSRTESVLRK